MKTSTIRFASLFAAALIVLSTLLLASCAGGADENTTPVTTAASQAGPDVSQTEGATEGTTAPVFASADYNGEPFTVYMRVNSTYSAEYIDSDEENGDIMNDQVWRRNVTVEEKYKVTIETKSDKTPYKQLANAISGGTVDYDLILDRRCELATSSVSGLLYDFNRLDIDYSRPWWDDSAAGYTVAGRLFMMANDVSVANLSGARFLYFNKQIVDNFHLKDPYDLVKQDKWYFDEFLTMLKSASEDRGTGELGVYGILCETGASNGNHMHLLVGCGVKATKRGPDGEMQPAIAEQVEKISDVFERLGAVLNNPQHALTYGQVSELFLDGVYKNKYDQGRGAFAAGHFLFVQNGMGVAVQFADMQDGYGLVPNPKYDENQEKYYHKIDKYSIIWGVPNAPDKVDTDRLAKVFDYWAYVSSETVMPTYYEVTIKTRRFNDPIASDMLDIVKGSLVYDACDIYGVNINSTLDTAYTNGSVGSTLSSSYMKTVDSAIKSIVASINKKYTD